MWPLPLYSADPGPPLLPPPAPWSWSRLRKYDRDCCSFASFCCFLAPPPPPPPEEEEEEEDSFALLLLLLLLLLLRLWLLL